MRHHLAADLREAADPPRDRNEVVFVERGQIARHVPVAAHHLGREIGPIQIAFHHARAANQQHALPAARKILARVDVDHLHFDACHGLADRADAVAALARRRVAAGRPVSGDHRRQLRGPVAFDRQHAEPLLEGGRQVGRELFRAGKDHVPANEDPSGSQRRR